MACVQLLFFEGYPKLKALGVSYQYVKRIEDCRSRIFDSTLMSTDLDWSVKAEMMHDEVRKTKQGNPQDSLVAIQGGEVQSREPIDVGAWH